MESSTCADWFHIDSSPSKALAEDVSVSSSVRSHALFVSMVDTVIHVWQNLGRSIIVPQPRLRRLCMTVEDQEVVQPIKKTSTVSLLRKGFEI